jgi:hypothetical protein
MKSKYGVLVALSIFMLALAVAPKAGAGWTTTNPGINVWIDPNLGDNLQTVYYGGESWDVSAVTYGWDQVTWFNLHVKNDNYSNNVNLKWEIEGIVEGPFPSDNWITNGWVGFARWDYSVGAWVNTSDTLGGIIISDLDNGENFLGRIGFVFSSTSVRDARSFFPAEVRVQLRLRNTDNNEIYEQTLLTWWVWEYPLENTINYAVADTYVAAASATTNYGSAASMLSLQGPPSDFIYMKFPLTLPANWGVQSAALMYYVNVNGGGADTRRLYSTIETDWLENGITYNTMLTDDDFLSDVCPHAVGWNMVDISSYITAQVASGATVVSFDYRNQSAVADNLRTKEYGDGSYAPRLILEIAPMGLSTPPTFDVVLGTLVTDWSGDYANILLRGRVDNMGDDSSANFMFLVDSTQWDTYETYTYPAAVTSTGFFSLSTMGYQFHRGSMYGVRLQCHGNNTQTFTWMPAVGYYMFTVENTIGPPPPPGHLPCTLTTTDVKGITESGATVYFSFTVGANNSLSVYLDIGENADNLDNCTSFSYGSFTWSAAAYSWDSSYAFSGLDNGVTYYVRARGMDAGFVVVNGGWMVFTTLGAPPPPPPPPSHDPGRINITNFADWVGNYLFGGVTKADGSSTAHEAGGLFLSAIIIICILVALAYIKVPQLGIVGVLIVLVGLLTAITWVPLWIGLVIGLGFSLLMAQKVVKAVK